MRAVRLGPSTVHASFSRAASRTSTVSGLGDADNVTSERRYGHGRLLVRATSQRLNKVKRSELPARRGKEHMRPDVDVPSPNGDSKRRWRTICSN